MISEPSYNHLYIAAKGALWLEVSTFGRMAHGSTPDLGINTILHMNAFLNEFAQFCFDYREHDLLGGPSTNVGTINGGIKTNVVPDKCTLSIDMRSVPGMQHGPIVEKINKICEKLGSSIKDFKAKGK